MFKPWCFLHLSFLYFCLSAAAIQESVEFTTLFPLHTFPRTTISLAVSLPIEDLQNVSKSVLEAEKWVRANVLAHYPGIKITTILVGQTLLCNKSQENKVSLILPSVKNIYYSLTRWGLEGEIKVSTTFSSKCLDQDSRKHNEKYVKPILDFTQQINAPYVVAPPSDFDEKIETLVDGHLGFLKRFGNFSLNIVFLKEVSSFDKKYTLAPAFAATSNFSLNKILLNLRKARKLSSFDKKYTLKPAFEANSPLPPLIGNISPPPAEMPPLFNPISPSYGPHLPPCIPSSHGGPAAGPEAREHHNGLWCVAKPSVPPETLQEALDYACGEGGADCEAIGPAGSCFYPDTVVAHASYAFNSYWQKTKGNGGSCGFGGTAMLINSDPSYRRCRFILA